MREKEKTLPAFFFFDMLCCRRRQARIMDNKKKKTLKVFSFLVPGTGTP